MTFSTVAVGGGMSQVARKTMPPTTITATRTRMYFAIDPDSDETPRPQAPMHDQSAARRRTSQVLSQGGDQLRRNSCHPRPLGHLRHPMVKSVRKLALPQNLAPETTNVAVPS